MTESDADLLAKEAKYLSPSARIGFFPLVVDHGNGCWFTDRSGRRFLDFHSMACVLNTGHNHPRVVGAIQKQADRLIHVNSAYMTHEGLVTLAARLAELCPGTVARRVAFGLSGSDANDGAMKLARAATGRSRIIAFRHSYHGNTYGALSMSAVSLSMRRGFGPEIPDVHHVTFPDVYRMDGDITDNCIAELEDLFATRIPGDEVAAVFIEPVQGDAGIVVPPARYLELLAELCRRHGILLVAEEVQTGIGRTGAWFACERFPVAPDIVVCGKALGSGMPVSAVIARAELMDAWSAPGHVFSTAANALCCAAANATLDIVEDEGLLENAVRMGQRLRAGLVALAAGHEVIGDVRGDGLMLGVDLVTDRATRERARTVAASVVAAAFDRGLYLTFLRGNVLRIAPPLTIGPDEVDLGLEILGRSLDDAVAGRVPEADIAAVVGW
ncbi:aspartate aminotransferase family protein [Pseudonocardia acaciae]|uniref:aspartate aminotransferase family protein n=1 Tax=Pseudonocardia acaciae TaxID=551276 RepID=UPI0005628523|nr:aminotransferase class III-fold pyridoxal phosphate-dependent enzyme [Pseudonocardia acaciae]